MIERYIEEQIFEIKDELRAIHETIKGLPCLEHATEIVQTKQKLENHCEHTEKMAQKGFSLIMAVFAVASWIISVLLLVLKHG